MTTAAAAHYSRHRRPEKQQREQQKQLQLQQQQQQQQPQQRQQRRRRSAATIQQHHRHRLQYQLQLPQSFAAAVVYGVVVVVAALVLATICVNGQIDGYIAGVDYPVYEAVPKGLSFNCQGRTPGYYADIETRCQVWHWCLHSGHQYSFLCPNGTVFNQAVRVCDWWSNVNCPASEQLYRNNEELYRTVDESESQRERDRNA